MDQHIYYGNIDPPGLADYLVSVFHQQPPLSSRPRTMAQKIVQGERIFVQIMRTGGWGSGGHRAVGVHIGRIAGGVSVEMGASDWLDLDETGLAGMLLGVLFFPPLLLFPLLQGLAGSGFPQEVWQVIDAYCMQASAGQAYRPRPPQGFYCTYCGAFNHPGAVLCHACHAPFGTASTESPVSETAAPQAEQRPPETNTTRARGVTRPMPALVTCPQCKAEVAPARFCGNCAAPLRAESNKEKGIGE